MAQNVQGPIRRPGLVEVTPETQAEIATNFLAYITITGRNSEPGKDIDFIYSDEAYLRQSTFVDIAPGITNATPLFIDHAWSRLYELNINMKRLKQFASQSNRLRPKDKQVLGSEIINLRFLEPGVVDEQAIAEQSLCLNSLALALEDGSLRTSHFNYRRRGASFWALILQGLTPTEF